MINGERADDSHEWNEDLARQELYLLGVDSITISPSREPTGQRSIMATADEGTRSLHFGFDENHTPRVTRVHKESGEPIPAAMARDPHQIATQRTWLLLDELRTNSQLTGDSDLAGTVVRPKPLHERTNFADFEDVTFISNPSAFFAAYSDAPERDAAVDERFAFEKLGQELLLEHGITSITIMHIGGLAVNHVAWISRSSSEDGSDLGYGIRQTGEVIRAVGDQVVNRGPNPQKLPHYPALEKLWRMSAMLFERLPNGAAYGAVNLDQPNFRDWMPRAEVERREAVALKEGLTRTLQEEYLFERLLVWAASNGTAEERLFLERAIDTNRDYRFTVSWLRHRYGEEHIDAALLQAKEEADSIIERPFASDAEEMADDLYRYKRLLHLTRQEAQRGGGGEQIATFAAIAPSVETICQSRQRDMQVIAQQPELSTFTQTVLDRLLNHTDPTARAQAAELVLEYATHDFSAGHRIIDRLARDPDKEVRHTLNSSLWIEHLRSTKRFEGQRNAILSAYEQALKKLDFGIDDGAPLINEDIDAHYLPEK